MSDVELTDGEIADVTADLSAANRRYLGSTGRDAEDAAEEIANGAGDVLALLRQLLRQRDTARADLADAIAERDSFRSAVNDEAEATDEYRAETERLRAEIAAARAGLRRLSSPECFWTPGRTSEEERRRMFYAKRVAEGGDPTDMQETRDDWRPLPEPPDAH